MSLLRKKLQEHSRSIQKESTFVTSSNSTATDPLLLSFVYNPSPQLHSSAEPSSLSKDDTSDCDIPACKDHEEKAQKSDFIQTILLSTIFPDNL
ncbi:hypothetical protein L2E82_13275 [Cichorium intybus]|uniref:Uncharacterized protein n=1 Tax=Cichorium intybus TaxID=13427 RepID=A0ACB9GID4_CICIN|nr:hypothetical protein L2E82_13275 [Cichorium intybus]